MYQPTPTIIFVYPTPENSNMIQYKDYLNNCFSFSPELVECPSDKSKIYSIPIQDGISEKK
tara:strand:- start:1033 stop:1215 length:183 start_codon:yes stop_codon:yes gene_type:complete